MENKELFMWGYEKDLVFSEMFESIEECIKEMEREGEEEYDGQTFIYIGTIKEPSVDISSFGDTIIDEIKVQLDDEVGEFSDAFDPTKRDSELLNKKIELVVKDWLKSVGGCNCFSVVDIKKYDINTGKEMVE